MRYSKSKINHQTSSIEHRHRQKAGCPLGERPPASRIENRTSRIVPLASCFLLLVSCLLLARCAWADDNVVMEVKDDLTVLGTSGDAADPDVDIAGYTLIKDNLDLNLDALTEGFTLDKVLTAGAAYTDNEFVLTREITGGAWNLSGDLLRIWDKSATTGTNTANLLNLGTGGTFSSMFKVDLTGDVTAGDKTSFHGVEYTWPNSIAGDNYVLSVNQTTGDLTWKSVAGVDGVSVSGSPVANQVAVWASPSSILGDANFTWNGSSLALGDTALSPSGSNVLSLATSDSFNIVSGNLQAGGNNVITPDPYLRVGDGAAATPSVSFLNDENSGMYSLGADKLGIITNGTATQGIFIDATGQVGIGTTQPDAKLDVVGGGILAQGTTGSTPVSGAGTRLMWIPADKAFRAGVVIGSEWDAGNIGLYSVAMGAASTASGNASFTMGWGSTASGDRSVAMGWSSTASGTSSVAMGRDITASGDYSLAMGRYMQLSASADRTFVFGYSDSAVSIDTADAALFYGVNMGIGDITPDGLLDVELTGAKTASAYGINLSNLATNTTTDGIDKYGTYITSTGDFTGLAGTATNNWGLYVDTVSGADNNYGAYIAGNVGIGTTNPAKKLEVASSGMATFKVDPASADRIDFYADGELIAWCKKD